MKRGRETSEIQKYRNKQDREDERRVSEGKNDEQREFTSQRCSPDSIRTAPLCLIAAK